VADFERSLDIVIIEESGQPFSAVGIMAALYARTEVEWRGLRADGLLFLVSASVGIGLPRSGRAGYCIR
jgi:hypothetical protein